MFYTVLTDRKNKAESNNSTMLSDREPPQQTVKESHGARQHTYGNQAALQRMKAQSHNPLQRGILQRKCACGNAASGAGTCSGCQERQEMALQTKLRISEPGDEYEQEADRVAEQVMRMPDIATPHRQTNPTFSSLFLSPRKYVNSEAERIQRQPFLEEEEEEEIDGSVLQTKQTSNMTRQTPEVTPDIEANVLASQSGGRPLPTTTRSFFEERFGRDLSEVRIHTDVRAKSLNQSLQAYAFTYQNHIWLGDGLSLEPSHLLAHELTHVIQQTEIPRLARTQSVVSSTLTSPVPSLQCFAPYWEPADYNGTRLHNEVLPEISQHAHIFVEAPVPNADRLSADYDKRGMADLYQATRTVGVYFSANQVPARLPSPRRLRFNGSRYPHTSEAAPKVGRLQTVFEVGQAPDSIKVGDLKPSHGTIEALEGTTQLNNYLDGFRLAAREVNELEDNGKADARWNIADPSSDLRYFNATELDALVPPKYQPSTTGQSAKQLILKQNSRPAVRPPIRATGKLTISPDPENQGILNYVWIPDLPPTFTLPPRLQSLGEEVRQRIVNPLLRAPERTIAPMARQPIGLTRLHQPRIQRTLRDSFDLGSWRTTRRQVRQQFRAMRGTPDWQNARASALVIEAHQAIRNETGLNVPEPPQPTRDNARTFEQLEFWTGHPAGIFGLFRRLFGRTFVRVAEAYQGMRRRFSSWLRGLRPSSAGGGLPGAAIKAVFSVLKMAGVLVLGRTLDLLRDSLVQGVTRKLVELIPEENIAELQDKLQEVQQLRDELQQQSVNTAEAIIEAVFPNFSSYLNRIQQVTAIVGNITRFINWVRWGARAIACVSPPAVGCLWALGEAVLGELAAVVAQSCWFQQKIAPLVARVDFIRVEIPRELSRIIINAIRNLLPANLHDVFADVTVESIRPEEIECDTAEGLGRPLTEEGRAVLELQEKLGEERFTALMDLLRSSNLDAGVPLNRRIAEQIGGLIEQEGLSASDLQRIARNPRGAPVELSQFLQQLRQMRQRSPIEPVLPEPSPQGAGDLDEEVPEYTTVVVGSREPSPEQPEATQPVEAEQPDGISTSDRRTEVLEADAQSVNADGGPAITGWSIRIVRVRDPLAEGNIVRIDLRMSRREGGHQRVRFLRNLRTEVVEIVPSERNPREQEAFLEIVENQSFEFSSSEVYIYKAGVEFIYRIPRSRP